MDDASESCPDCATAVATADNYCRNCGMYLTAMRAPLPMVRPLAPVEAYRPRASMPAPVRKAATALAIGAAVQIGLGLTTRYLMKSATQRAVGTALGVARKGAGPKALAKHSDAGGAIEAVSETVVVRRVWMKRG